jgi:hypothetical protein
MRDDDLEPVRRWTAEEIARECGADALQSFIRKNFGLYHPPADYVALRAENLRRSKFQRPVPASTSPVNNDTDREPGL